MSVHRTISVLAKMNGEIRTASYGGVDHLILPTIAIMEGVVWPYASETKELVLASELEKMGIQQWNGRPVTMDHPFSAGRPVSANSPDVLERYLFGYAFGADLRDKQLHLEAWLNLGRVAMLGADAESIIKRAEEKQEIEVSVGVFMEPEEKHGTYTNAKGQKSEYDIIWRNITADHLAMLPEGTIGACSVEMGCGAPRVTRAAAGRRTHVFLTGAVDIKESNLAVETKTLTQRVLEKFNKLRTAAVVETGQSSSELHNELYNLLFAEEPAFIGIWDVFPEDGLVVYGVAPNNEMKLYRRKFSSEDGKVGFSGGRKEVEPVTRYETMEAAEAPTISSHDCGCGGKKDMAVNKERIAALISSKKNGFTAASQAVLESMTEEQIKALEDSDAAVPEATTTPTPGPTHTDNPAPSTPSTPSTPTPKAEEKVLTAAEKEAEWRKTAPPAILSMLDDKVAQDKTERTNLMSALAGQKVYTAAELETMPLPDLRKVAALAGVPSGNTDFSLRGIPRVAAENDAVPAPKRTVAYLAEHQQKKTATK
jgi:hypothetical protein